MVVSNAHFLKVSLALQTNPPLKTAFVIKDSMAHSDLTANLALKITRVLIVKTLVLGGHKSMKDFTSSTLDCRLVCPKMNAKLSLHVFILGLVRATLK